MARLVPVLVALALALVPLLAGPAAAQTWCGQPGLNTTERAICRDRVLGGLDAQLNATWESRGGSAQEQADWLRERNACGADIFCIEAAYRDRIDELQAAPVASAPPRRPWCRNTPLNPTEAAVCGSETLANMDAAMAAVYGQAIARADDRSQIAWLTDMRTRCGGDERCIGQAYLERIVELGGRLRAEGR